MITAEAERLLAVKERRNANQLLVASFVGRGVGYLAQKPNPTAPQSKLRRAFVRSKQHRAVRQWLETNPSGARCTRCTFQISPSSSQRVFASFVEAGELRMIHPAHRGPQGYPALYEKV